MIINSNEIKQMYGQMKQICETAENRYEYRLLNQQ